MEQENLCGSYYPHGAVSYGLSVLERTLDVNTALCEGEPLLRNYSPVDRGAILLGARDVTLIVWNKKFTQGSPMPVELGRTRINLCTYLVYVHNQNHNVAATDVQSSCRGCEKRLGNGWKTIIS